MPGRKVILMKVKSAGVVLFRNNPNREYLILRYSTIDRYWGFAKGHIEKDENEKQAAFREVEEETGLKNIRLVDGFKEEDEYSFLEEGSMITKEVIWFLGEVNDENEMTLSHEHENFKWLNYNEALELLSFKELKELLKKVETKLSQS